VDIGDLLSAFAVLLVASIITLLTQNFKRLWLRLCRLPVLKKGQKMNGGDKRQYKCGLQMVKKCVKIKNKHEISEPRK
jgi:hypothetical protein